MPEVLIKEIRLPELHLPEISRDDIRRSLSEIHLPDVDLSNMVRPRVDLPNIDIGKAIAGVAAAAHLTRPSHRRRWQSALGALIVAGLAGWAVLSNAALRERISKAVDGLRQRADSMRSGSVDELEVNADLVVAFPAAEVKPIEASLYADVVSGTAGANGTAGTNDTAGTAGTNESAGTKDSAGSAGYPDGLGAGGADRLPTVEEPKSR